MCRAFATVTIVMVVSAANATITADHFLWASGRLPERDVEYFTYRLQVHVTTTPGHSDDDDWTAAGLEAYLAGGVFFQHPEGGDPPNPAFFPFAPDLEYDSYYTSPGNYPNDDYAGSGWWWPDPPEPHVLDREWFDTADTGNGDFVIAQFTVLPREPDWVVTGLLQYAAADTGGQLFDYAFTIPEPGTVTLLALGGLAMMRRQR